MTRKVCTNKIYTALISGITVRVFKLLLATNIKELTPTLSETARKRSEFITMVSFRGAGRGNICPHLNPTCPPSHAHTT